MSPPALDERSVISLVKAGDYFRLDLHKRRSLHKKPREPATGGDERARAGENGGREGQVGGVGATLWGSGRERHRRRVRGASEVGGRQRRVLQCN
jgi:hypothetical protein